MRANERHNERENYKFLKCNVPSAAKGHVRTKRDKRGREREGESRELVAVAAVMSIIIVAL